MVIVARRLGVAALQLKVMEKVIIDVLGCGGFCLSLASAAIPSEQPEPMEVFRAQIYY
jgi:hypothetical protein